MGKEQLTESGFGDGDGEANEADVECGALLLVSGRSEEMVQL